MVTEYPGHCINMILLTTGGLVGKNKKYQQQHRYDKPLEMRDPVSLLY